MKGHEHLLSYYEKCDLYDNAAVIIPESDELADIL